MGSTERRKGRWEREGKNKKMNGRREMRAGNIEGEKEGFKGVDDYNGGRGGGMRKKMKGR